MSYWRLCSTSPDRRQRQGEGTKRGLAGQCQGQGPNCPIRLHSFCTMLPSRPTTVQPRITLTQPTTEQPGPTVVARTQTGLRQTGACCVTTWSSSCKPCAPPLQPQAPAPVSAPGCLLLPRPTPSRPSGPLPCCSAQTWAPNRELQPPAPLPTPSQHLSTNTPMAVRAPQAPLPLTSPSRVLQRQLLQVQLLKDQLTAPSGPPAPPLRLPLPPLAMCRRLSCRCLEVGCSPG
ncbi:hypothetical protein V8C86DRAFT_2833608 [Haematococcus lacustris]